MPTLLKPSIARFKF